MRKIKGLLHGSQRREYRERININVRRRETLRRDMKWRKVLGSILGPLGGRRHQDGVDLNLLESKDGTVIGDENVGHKVITDSFEKEWFAKPEWCKGTLHDLADGQSWQSTMEQESRFLSDTAYTRVPVEWRKLIFKAIKTVPNRAEIHSELQESLRDPPSLLDFEEAIRKSKTNSAAGMTGVSYNMLKKLPGVLVANLHKCLSRIWASKSTPEWWTQKWCVPIPKNPQDITNVANLRPLMLVDAVRKIWCKLLLRKILVAWKKYDALRHTQHGFCGGKSTMTASLLFINMLEDAIENDAPAHVCSWDITRAFDSVAKNIMRLAWSRLGVPQEWVEWLVAMDVNGLTVVRTPKAIKVWDKAGVAGFRKQSSQDEARSEAWEDVNAEEDSYKTTAEGFVADRGTGQGDVTSPACWGAFFDILLTALELDAEEQPGRWVRAGGNMKYRAADTAYADDLLSFTRTPDELQRKADIVSAFCAIMGLQMSTQNFVGL